MTRATIQVQIPRPCAEAWEAMAPTAQGRHCAACQRTVTDFTHRSDAEVLAILSQAAGGRVCGRFRPEQLQRALGDGAAPATAPRWQAWLLAAAAVWGLRSLATNAASAQTAEPLPQQLAPISAHPKKTWPAEAPADKPTRRVRGIVLEAGTDTPLPGVTVLLKGMDIGVSAAADGTFELVIPRRGSALQVTYPGFEAQEVLLPPEDQTLRVELEPDTRPLSGEVVIIKRYSAPWYSPRGLWQRLRGLSSRLIHPA